jgi:hypothetical protein
MQLIDPKHPFYRPLWRRIAIVGVCAAWFLFEILVSRDALFMPITAALVAYAAWVLLVGWKEPQD